MIAHLKELKILRAVIDGKTWIDIMLITLLSSKIFRLSYSKSRGLYILGRIPERTAGSTGDHWPSDTLTGGGERFFIFCKEELYEEKAPKLEGKCVAKGKWEQTERQVPPLQADMILEKGLPKYKARTQNNTLGMPASKVVVTCLVVCITSTWWVYTGTTSHVCNSLQGFQETQ